MATLNVSLLGEFRVRYDEQVVSGLEGWKVRELLCYLLLHRDRTLQREGIAESLWAENNAVQAKKYLRQALWQLQTALPERADVLLVDGEQVRINPQANLCLDIDVVERTFVRVRDKSGRDLDGGDLTALHEAVGQYRGVLLDGWYQDWCLYERERLHLIYFALLDKLIQYSETHGDYEIGLVYGEQILRYDRASERTHRHLMRLHYLNGDRTAALRQYERCIVALKQELDVRPARSTVALYEEVRDDIAPAGGLSPPTGQPAMVMLGDLLAHMQRLCATLGKMQQEVQKEIEVVEHALRK